MAPTCHPESPVKAYFVTRSTSKILMSAKDVWRTLKKCKLHRYLSRMSLFTRCSLILLVEEDKQDYCKSSFLINKLCNVLIFRELVQVLELVSKRTENRRLCQKREQNEYFFDLIKSELCNVY